MHQQDLLQDYFSHVGALAGQDRISDVKRNYPGDRRSWHLSALSRITQLLQELLLELVLHQCPITSNKNFLKISNKFSSNFKAKHIIMFITSTQFFFKCPPINVEICKPSDFVHFFKVKKFTKINFFFQFCI